MNIRPISLRLPCCSALIVMPSRCPRVDGSSTSREKSACCRMERCPRRSRRRPRLAGETSSRSSLMTDGVEDRGKITDLSRSHAVCAAAGVALAKHFGDGRPGRRTFIVKALVNPAFLIEIEAVVVGAARPRSSILQRPADLSAPDDPNTGPHRFLRPSTPRVTVPRTIGHHAGETVHRRSRLEAVMHASQ